VTVGAHVRYASENAAALASRETGLERTLAPSLEP
jgi:hypothetical protein